LKIGLACGGTGGHIFPGLATARVLRQRGHEVVLWLAGKDIETPALKTWEGEVITVRAEGLPSGLSLRALRSGWKLFRAAAACTSIMRKNRPDALLAMGSYASVGPLSAARFLKIPMVLHESNVLPGRAISLFSRWATVAGSFEETRFYLPRKELVLTGMPLRQDLEQAAMESPTRTFGKETFTILVIGGSRGARKLNDIVCEALCRLHALGQKIRVIHLSGVADEETVRSAYEKAGVDHLVFSFAHNMAELYAETDFAICRSGAATCAELSAFGIPALMVPYPFAARDHQMVNARALEKIGAVDVVPEKDLGVPWLVDYINGCFENTARLVRMSHAAKSRAVKSGAEALANLVEAMVARTRPPGNSTRVVP
jgi:UDP-N-acetylglucosamine--N-acetylmuramyl-(pentapeptide) pyrophosphoryl-undecaprenol N-acetylglucosamine transferase